MSLSLCVAPFSFGVFQELRLQVLAPILCVLSLAQVGRHVVTANRLSAQQGAADRQPTAPFNSSSHRKVGLALLAAAELSVLLLARGLAGELCNNKVGEEHYYSA